MDASKKKETMQLIWGVALILMGIAIMIMTPQKLAELEIQSQSTTLLYFGRFSMYLFSIILIGGGMKKVIPRFRHAKKKHSQPSE